MKLNGFSPMLVLLAGSDQLWNMQSVGVGSDMVHQSMWEILSKHNTKVGVDSIMGSIMAHALLKKTDQLFMISKLLVVLNEFFQMIWKDNNVETTLSSSGEFLCSYT